MDNSTGNYEKWETPQRQSPAAIFLLLGTTLISLLKTFWPVLLLVVFKNGTKGGVWEERIVWMALVLTCITIIGTIANFWFFRFYVSNGSFVLQSGWIKKKTLTISLQNIHAVHLEQNLWQQALQVTKLTIDSAGSEKTEASINALSTKNAEQLKSLLLSQVNYQIKQENSEKKEKVIQIRLSTADLFKFSLSSNHLEAFFILIGLSLNLIDDIKDAFNIDSWGLMESYVMKMAGQTAMAMTILFVSVALFSIIVSVIKTWFKFYKYNIEQLPNGWKVSFGLITHQEKVISSNKIQILSWKANWLRRKINFWILNVKSIGHDKPKQKEQIQIPLTSFESVLSLIPIYQDSPLLNLTKGLKIKPDYWKRKILIIGLPISIPLITIFYLLIGLPSLSFLILLPYFGWYFYTWYTVFRWQYNAEGLQMYSGVWGREYTLLAWRKVQQIQVDQTAYQRKHQLASLTFKTAGGKVKLPYIQLSMAKHLADLSLYYVESREDNWM